MKEKDFDFAGKLGVNHSLEFTKDYTILKFYKKGKVVSKRKIPPVKRVSGLKKLGEAQGMSLPHCFYLAGKYCKDFLELVYTYKVAPGGSKEYTMTVTFYRKKKS